MQNVASVSNHHIKMPDHTFNTNGQDLVELAGYHAYRKYDIPLVFTGCFSTPAEGLSPSRK